MALLNISREFQKYKNMKNSGVDWIGYIPEHWITKRLKSNTIIKGRVGWQALTSDEFIDEGPYCVTGTDFESGNINWETCYHVSIERYEMDTNIQLLNNDLLITKDGTIGKIALVVDIPGKACLNSGIFVIRPKNDDYLTSFMYYVLKSKVFHEFIQYRKIGSTISHLYQYEFKEMPYPQPLLSEQKEISSFLQQKTYHLDQLIAKKQQLIELLQEKRQALITQAVTKGLDPTVAMKNSGIEWLKEIPAHWETRKLSRNFTEIGSGTTPKSSNEEYYTSGIIPWVNSGDLNDDVLFETKKKITQFAKEEYRLKLYQTGSIVIALYGATIGKLAILGIDATVNQACCVVNNSKRIQNDFLFYYLMAVRKNLINMSLGGGQPNISQEIIKSVRIPTPAIQEQQSILEFIQENTTRYDEILSKLQNQIELVQEYRQTLITNAVTGKIDVRGEGTDAN